MAADLDVGARRAEPREAREEDREVLREVVVVEEAPLLDSGAPVDHQEGVPELERIAGIIRRFAAGALGSRIAYVDAIALRLADGAIEAVEGQLIQDDIDAAPPLDPDLDPELLRALAALTDDQREVVVLRYVADLSVRDVARILDRRAGAVKMLQARGLAALEQRLADPDA